jgi:hypothetical protein
VDEMTPTDDDDMISPDGTMAARDEATLARIKNTPREDLSPRARERYDKFSAPPPAAQDVSALPPRWSPTEILEMIGRDHNIFGGPENTQVVLQVAILEALLSIEEKLSNRDN